MVTQELKPPSHSEVVCIDISANLLSGYFEERRADRRKGFRGSAIKASAALGSLILVGVLFSSWESAQSTLAEARSKVSQEQQTLKASRAGFPSVQVPDDVLKMPIQFREKNDSIVREIGHVLAARGLGMSLLSLRYSEEGTAGPKLVGQAESRDIQTVRALLDRVQVALPGTEGMITSVAQPQGLQTGAFTITFEIKPAPSTVPMSSGGKP